jgi:hypothetical protein
MTDPLESNGCGRGYRINAKWGGSRVVVCIKTISNIKDKIITLVKKIAVVNAQNKFDQINTQNN